jgi:molecular chaperone GrpE
LAHDLLEVVDNLERALSHEGATGGDEVLKGVRLVYDRFVSILDRHGIKGESAIGTLFDPAKHEALASVQSAEQPAGTVMNELKRTYFFKDKLLRPGQVVVVAAPAPADAPQGSQPPADSGDAG